MRADRRRIVALLAASVSLSFSASASAQAPGMNRTTYAFSFAALDGAALRLAEHAGKLILVVNTASLCGYTPQYAGLQELWTRFKDRGLLIVGVPSNDFGGHEPGGEADISHTAHGSYGVTFPIANKAEVRGANAHPFYRWVAAERPFDAPRWNFHKYLIGRDGRIAAVFPSAVGPTDPQVVAAIMKELVAE